MKAKSLRDQTSEELRQLCEDTEKEIFDFKIQRSTGADEQPLKIRGLRRDLARIKTVIREGEIK